MVPEHLHVEIFTYYYSILLFYKNNNKGIYKFVILYYFVYMYLFGILYFLKMGIPL